jgi:hypothetical protein
MMTYSYDRRRVIAGTSLASYFESFLTTMADACAARLGSNWKTHTIKASNTELTGAFITFDTISGGQLSTMVECTGKAVRCVSDMIMPPNVRFQERGGGSVFLDGSEIGRNLASLVHKTLVRQNPNYLTALPLH